MPWIHCPNRKKNGCKVKYKNQGNMTKHLMTCNRDGPPPWQTYTLSPDVTQRKTAEAYLNGCKRTAGFPVVLLQLARPPAPGA